MKTCDSQLPSNKSFGYLFAFIFLVIGSYFLFANLFFLYVIFFSLAILFILSSIFFPDYLFILNKLWMKFGMILATIINPIILGFIFLFIFTPIGLFLKLIKRDELGLKVKKKISYWKNPNSLNKNSSSFKNQF